MSYKGKITTAGTSDAIRLSKDLFRQHPEFKQQTEVTAHVIGPGKLLISVENTSTDNDFDPIVDAFLSFLEADISNNIGTVTPLDADIIERAKVVTAGVTFTDEDFE